MKWPMILVLCAGLAAAQGCLMRNDSTPPHNGTALERLYQTDLVRAEKGEADAMMRLGRYHDHGLSANDRCAGAMAPLCRIGVVSRWLAGTVVAPDRARAYKWYSLAALGEHRNASEAKRSLMPEMTPGEIDEGERMIAEWLTTHPAPSRQRAAEGGP